MIKITKDNEALEILKFKKGDYIKKRFFIGRTMLVLTRHLRAINAEKYMKPAERHLDMGCGDGYFLKRSKCLERFGIDRLLGDEITDHLDFPDSYFDYVTMLAVIEHLSNPEAVVREAYRILKPKGRLIITTPKKYAEMLIKIYVKDIEDVHKRYFNDEDIKKLSGSMFKIVNHHTFILGLNQVFCLEKYSHPDEDDST